jgi:hypothetical protein
MYCKAKEQGPGDRAQDFKLKIPLPFLSSSIADRPARCALLLVRCAFPDISLQHEAFKNFFIVSYSLYVFPRLLHDN